MRWTSEPVLEPHFCGMSHGRSTRLAPLWRVEHQEKFVELAASEAARSDTTRRLRAQLTDADHLRRVCSFLGWAPTAVLRRSAGEEGSNKHETRQDDPCAQQACDADASHSSPVAASSPTSLLWHASRARVDKMRESRPEAEMQAPSHTANAGRQTSSISSFHHNTEQAWSNPSLADGEDDSTRGIWATELERTRTREHLFSALQHPPTAASGTSPYTRPARVEILEPQDGQDLLFEAFADKGWRVRASVHDFELGHGIGYACVYLDGVYKGCSLDAEISLTLDDPGLDYTWHLLEVRWFLRA